MSWIKTYSISGDITGGEVGHSNLFKEFADSSITSGVLENITEEGDDLGLYFSDELSSEDKTALDTLIQDHIAVTLSEARQLKYDAIDQRTDELISDGFIYDSNTFSLSIESQSNMNAVKTNQSEFTFPLDVTTIDNDVYSLAEEDVDAFWSAAKVELKTHLDSGRTLKKSVFDAANRAAVDAVTDSR